MLVGTYFIFSGVELAPGKVAQMKAAGTYARYLSQRDHESRAHLCCTGFGGPSACTGDRAHPVSSSCQRKLRTQRRRCRQLAEMRAYPHLWLAVAAQFFYVGAQVTTWSAFIPYMKQYTNVTEREAGWFLTGNLILLLIGHFASTWLMRWIRPVKMVAAYAIANSILMTLALLRPGFAGAMAVMTSSFFMSIMFPTIFALGVKGLGGTRNWAAP